MVDKSSTVSSAVAASAAAGASSKRPMPSDESKMEVERTMMTLMAEEETAIDWDEMDLDFEDEITGATLERDQVIKAHQDEMKEYKSFDVYDEVDDELCWKLTGSNPVGTRWRVINKGDELHPDVRARLVAKQFKPKGWESIFAATPPL